MKRLWKAYLRLAPILNGVLLGADIGLSAALAIFFIIILIKMVTFS